MRGVTIQVIHIDIASYNLLSKYCQIFSFSEGWPQFAYLHRVCLGKLKCAGPGRIDRLLVGEMSTVRIPHIPDHFSRCRFVGELHLNNPVDDIDRKSTRLNSSHVAISYAVFCLKIEHNQDATLASEVADDALAEHG